MIPVRSCFSCYARDSCYPVLPFASKRLTDLADMGRLGRQAGLMLSKANDESCYNLLDADRHGPRSVGSFCCTSTI